LFSAGRFDEIFIVIPTNIDGGGKPASELEIGFLENLIVSA